MNSFLATLFLNELEFICLQTVKWFHMLYAHLQHHNDAIIKTQWQRRNDKDAVINDAGRKTQEDFFNNILPLTLFVRFRKGCVGFYCERELETEHKL